MALKGMNNAEYDAYITYKLWALFCITLDVENVRRSVEDEKPIYALWFGRRLEEYGSRRNSAFWDDY
jgi:hypothetical protein